MREQPNLYNSFCSCNDGCFVLAAICLAEGVPDSAGKPHPEYFGLQIGGDGSMRLEHVGHLGFLFQCLLLVQINLLSLLGVPERYRTQRLLGYMAGSLACMLIVGWKMYFDIKASLPLKKLVTFWGFLKPPLGKPMAPG